MTTRGVNSTKNSTNGTKYMASSLKAKDLCLIIKTCKEANVSNLKIGDTELIFFATDSYNQLELPPAGPSQVTTTNEDTPTDQVTTEIMEMFPEDREQLREEMHAQLLMDSPISFEEQMILENLGTGGIEVEDNGPKDRRSGETV